MGKLKIERREILDGKYTHTTYIDSTGTLIKESLSGVDKSGSLIEIEHQPSRVDKNNVILNEEKKVTISPELGDKFYGEFVITKTTLPNKEVVKKENSYVCTDEGNRVLSITQDENGKYLYANEKTLLKDKPTETTIFYSIDEARMFGKLGEAYYESLDKVGGTLAGKEYMEMNDVFDELVGDINPNA